MKTFPNHYFSSRIMAATLPFLSALPLELASGQGDYPMTYKSGINVNILGTAGTDYAVEEFYHDCTLADFKVVFLKDTTLIEMEHNANNIVGNDVVPSPIDFGIIRIKPDGDRRINLTIPNWREYAEPFTLGDLNYGIFGDTAVPVVGTTGDNGVPQTRSNGETHYFRGILDSIGDEWHTLTVVDDDAAYSTLQDSAQSEWRGSDGKVHLFVVNPKTPCLSWAVTGTGQFYTTPAKTFFVPHIYDQTTYFAAGSSGTVSVTIRDINGNNVFYRINGGSFTDAGASHVTLDQDDFDAGENTLEYYYAGNSEFTRTRAVVKNPAYPSASETHGDRLWLGSANFDTHIKEQLKANWWMSQWRTQELRHAQTSIETNKNLGKRKVAVGQPVINNALVARCYGMTEKRSTSALGSFADYAKYALMESISNLDPIGVELQENFVAKGAKELLYRGYYDVMPIFGYAGAYDILAGYYRADQGHANGITAIEDFFIRDSLARWVHLCALQIGGYSGTGSNVSSLSDNSPSNEPGMWTTARYTGAAMIACMMPGYSTPYYGTSGMGNEIPEYGSPFFLPHLSHTWFEVFVDDSVTPTGYPNGLQSPAGYSIQFNADGKWHDRISYSDTPLMGMPLGIYYNLLKMYHPTKTVPTFDLAMTAAAASELYGAKISTAGDALPSFRAWVHMQNAWHSEFRDAAQPVMLTKTKEQSLGNQLNSGGPFAVLWYNHEIPAGHKAEAPSPPTGVKKDQ